MLTISMDDTSSNPTASSSPGVKEPSLDFNASMMYTNTTEICPNNWIRPVEVPSGVGYVISAAYCIPIGATLTSVKPRIKAEKNKSQAWVAKVMPITAGI